jgi:predicted TIM-barrel fold metal-dependent hydrolase
MDEAGINVRVLSNSGPGPDLVPGPDGIAMAREMNDHLATAVARNPDRCGLRTILDQVWLTTSGIFSQPPFLAALLTFGIDRIMFSVDYPYAANEKGRDFRRHLARPGRHGQAHTQERGCTAKAGGRGKVKAGSENFVGGSAPLSKGT